MHIPADTSIVILTGAGISAESGISTFRDADGLWMNHAIEEVAHPTAFRRDPALVHEFYNQRRRQLFEVSPNAAHLALARLEQAWPGDFLLVTQNVDDLHDRAGSLKLIHMHGELRRVRCLKCLQSHPWMEDCLPETPCPACGKPSLRPHIVWFDEMPMKMGEITRALSRCGLFICIGTSGNVYPAAGFVQQASRQAHTLEVNAEETRIRSQFKETRKGLASCEVPRLVDELLGGMTR